ncbi:MAG: hypothetical protein QM692_21265 [Thermomicrobiales bacterium]
MSEAKTMNQRIRDAKESKQGGVAVTLSADKQSATSRQFGSWLRGEPPEAAGDDDEPLKFDRRGRLIEE